MEDPTEHLITTLESARQWWPQAKKADLPILIREYTTRSGRVARFVLDRNKRVVYTADGK